MEKQKFIQSTFYIINKENFLGTFDHADQFAPSKKNTGINVSLKDNNGVSYSLAILGNSWKVKEGQMLIRIKDNQLIQLSTKDTGVVFTKDENGNVLDIVSKGYRRFSMIPSAAQGLLNLNLKSVDGHSWSDNNAGSIFDSLINSSEDNKQVLPF